MSDVRPKQLKVRLSEGEQSMLKLLAARHGITVSDYLRMMIDRESNAYLELNARNMSPIEFSYQAELVRRGIAAKTTNGKKK